MISAKSLCRTVLVVSTIIVVNVNAMPHSTPYTMCAHATQEYESLERKMEIASWVTIVSGMATFFCDKDKLIRVIPFGLSFASFAYSSLKGFEIRDLSWRKDLDKRFVSTSYRCDIFIKAKTWAEFKYETHTNMLSNIWYKPWQWYEWYSTSARYRQIVESADPNATRSIRIKNFAKRFSLIRIYDTKNKTTSSLHATAFFLNGKVVFDPVLSPLIQGFDTAQYYVNQNYMKFENNTITLTDYSREFLRDDCKFVYTAPPAVNLPVIPHVPTWNPNKEPVRYARTT